MAYSQLQIMQGNEGRYFKKVKHTLSISRQSISSAELVFSEECREAFQRDRYKKTLSIYKHLNST